MKTHLIADAFTQIDDRYINESHPAAVHAANGELPRAEGPIRRFLGSGWGAAILSAACAILVLTAIILAGRMGADGPSPGPGGQVSETEKPTILSPVEPLVAGPFSFSYSIQALQGVDRGKTITINTTMTNISMETIRAQGSSSDREAHVSLYCITDAASGTLQDIAPLLAYTTNVVPHTYAPGETVSGELTFTIPEDAPTGAYHLELSYPYNPALAVTFEDVFTLSRPRVEPKTPHVTLTLNGEEYPLSGGHLITGSLIGEVESGIQSAIAIDGMPPTTLEDIRSMDGGAVVRQDLSGLFTRLDFESVRMSEGSATIREICLYNEKGEVIKSQKKPSLTVHLEEEMYYVVLTLDAENFLYTMGDMTYTVNGGIVAVIFRLVSPDYVVETEPETTPPVIPEECPFTFSYGIYGYDFSSGRYTLHRGDTITVCATMANTTDAPIAIPLNHPAARKPFLSIYQDLPDGRYDLVYRMVESVDENLTGTRVLHMEPGEAENQNYTLTIPDDAPTGLYTIKVYFDEMREWCAVFEFEIDIQERNEPATDPSPDEPALPDVEPFTFAYNITAPNGYASGADVQIHVAMTCVGEEPLHYEGSSSEYKPRIRLFALTSDGEEHRLDTELDSTTDIVPLTYNPGETVDATYSFRIPADAPSGDGVVYRLEMYPPLAAEYGITLFLDE